MKKGNWFLLAAALAATVDAGAASFDCSKASSRIDNAICASAHVSRLDDELSRVYADAMRVQLDSGNVRTEQREWLRETRNKCQDEACLVSAYRERIAKLRALTMPSKEEVESDDANMPMSEKPRARQESTKGATLQVEAAASSRASVAPPDPKPSIAMSPASASASKSLLEGLTMAQLDDKVRSTFFKSDIKELCLKAGMAIGAYVDDLAAGRTRADQERRTANLLGLVREGATAQQKELATMFMRRQFAHAKENLIDRDPQKYVRVIRSLGEQGLGQIALVATSGCAERLNATDAGSASRGKGVESGANQDRVATAQQQIMAQRDRRDTEIRMNQAQRLAQAVVAARATSSICAAQANQYAEGAFEAVKQYEASNMRNQAVPLVDGIIASLKRSKCL